MTKWILVALGLVLLANYLYMWWAHKNDVKGYNLRIPVILSLLFMAILPGFWVGGVASQLTGEFQKTEFCTDNCHVMETYKHSLTVQDDEPLASVHYRNNYVDQEKACYVCHTSYSAFGGVEAKIRGLNHVLVNYFKTIPDSLHLYSPYKNSDCLRCHGPSEKFQKEKKHLAKEDFLKRSYAEELRCLECHDVAHYVPSEEEDEDDFGGEDEFGDEDQEEEVSKAPAGSASPTEASEAPESAESEEGEEVEGTDD